MQRTVQQRVFSLILALVMVCACIYIPGMEVQATAAGSWSENAATGFSGGSGQAEDPYIISSGAELAYLAKWANTIGTNSALEGVYFQMQQGITVDLSAHYWVPAKFFKGQFDGNGATISGMTVTKDTMSKEYAGTYEAGLFGVVRPGAVVKNLTMDGVSIVLDQAADANYYVGGIAGMVSNATIDHCVVKGAITVTKAAGTNGKATRVGGIVGYCYCGGAPVTLTNCVNEADITVTNPAGAGDQLTVGGVLGWATRSNAAAKLAFVNCANLGDVTVSGACGVGYVGGLVGQIVNNNGTATVASCYNAGAVTVNALTGTTLGTGSAAGALTANTVADIYWQTGTHAVGGPSGFTYTEKSAAEMKGAEFAATMMQAALDAGASLGWEAVSGGYPAIGDTAPAIGPVSWVNRAAGAFAGGTGEKTNPFIITNGAELALVAKSYGTTAASQGVYFEIQQGSTIDLAAYDWEPITEFCGHFNGNGVQIQNMRIVKPCDISAAVSGSEAAGMFGLIHNGATVKNVTVDVDLTAESGKHLFVGGIAGQCRDAVVDNCKVSGAIRAAMTGGGWNNFLVGGVVGRLYSSSDLPASVLNCYNSAEITASRSDTNGNRCIGGIVGEAYATADSTASFEIINCANIGTITVSGTKGTRCDVGGVIGYMWRKNTNTTSKVVLKNCYNVGTVDAAAITDAATGGVAGTIASASYAEAAYLYYLDTAASGAGAGISATGMAAADMQAQAFADQLNANAREIAGGIAYGWSFRQDGYPVLGGAMVEAYVDWSVRGGSLGSVTVEIQESGSEIWTPISQPQSIPMGCGIRFTFAPGSNGRIKAVTVNGEEVTLTGNTYQMLGNGSITMAVIFVPLAEEAPENIYVNPNVTSVGYGTEERPYKTLPEAKAKITQILGERPYANIIVNMMGGTYVLDETLVLGTEQSSDGRVTFKNYNGETPVISGANQLPQGGFTKVEGKEYYSYQLQESDKVGGKWPAFRTLLVDGKSATLARTKDLVFTKSYPNEVMSGYGIGSCDNGIFLDKTAMAGITDANSKDLEVQMYIEWKVQIYHLENIADNGSDVSATIKASQWDEWYAKDRTKRTLTGKTYFLQNHLNFLDEAGEFYYDEETGTVYYYPYEGQDMSAANVAYAALDILVDIDHASNLTFDGISFTGTTANVFENGYIGQLGAGVFAYAGDVDGVNLPLAAIRGNYATGVVVQNCTFEELAGHGILFENGIDELEITGNVVRNVGITGILVGVNGQNITLPGASRNVNIRNNYVTNVGTVLPSGIGISVARCVNLKILHNKVIYVPYTGIRAGWGFNIHATENENINLMNAEIAYNHVENFLMKINDGGAIYTAGANGFADNTELFNSVHDNYIKGNGNRGTIGGIYHDGSSSNFHTYNNVLVDVKKSLHAQDDVPSQYTHNLTIENNYTTHSAMTSSAAADRNLVLRNNTLAADMDALPEAAKTIIAAAGLETAYSGIEAPIDVDAYITNPTVHFSIPKANAVVTVDIQLTNNSKEEKVFTLSMLEGLLNNVQADFVGNGAVWAPGETKNVQLVLSVIDPNAMEITSITAQGFKVTDQHGRETGYPRAFSLAITKSSAVNKVAYGTPVVDGVMDDIYKDSHRIPMGVVFHPNALAVSDVTGYTYLVWDEDYLYCYVVVNDANVVSRGIDFINQKDVNKIWASDTVETYIRTNLRGMSAYTKFALDAFGILRYSNAEADRNTFAYHNSLPFASAFTYNGEIVEGYSIKNPTAGQNASAAEHPVNGYVLEMTLPIKEIESLAVAGQPQEGDQFPFRIQVNDYDGTNQNNGEPYVVALQTENISMTLVKIPVITQEPADCEQEEGKDAEFKITVAAEGEVRYQWQVKSPATGRWTDIVGANESSYTAENVTMDMSGAQYRCVVTTEYSELYSKAGTLTVTEIPVPGTVENMTDETENAAGGAIDTQDEDLSEKLLTEDDRQQVRNGVDARIQLVVRNITGNVPEGDMQLIEAALGTNKAAMYLDITLLKQLGNNAPTQVTNTNGTITVSVIVPEAFRNGEPNTVRTFRMIRIHDGVASILPVDYNEQTGKAKFETDSFSTYALVYGDTESSGSNTGDSMEFVPVVGLMALSLAGLAAMLPVNKKRRYF